MATELSESEQERYSAQIERIGVDAQIRLKAARAIVIGAGAAGATAAAHLASRGVGYVAVADGAVTSLADLSGQAVLYTPDVGANRADAVVAKLGILNPNVLAESYPVDVEEQNAAAILMGHDISIHSGTGGPYGAAADGAAEVGVRLLRTSGGAGDGVMAAELAVNVIAETALDIEHETIG